MRYTVTQFARESVGLCPFRSSYLREFDHTVGRIIKITHAHSLQVKTLPLLQFVNKRTQIVY